MTVLVELPLTEFSDDPHRTVTVFVNPAHVVAVEPHQYLSDASVVRTVTSRPAVYDVDGHPNWTAWALTQDSDPDRLPPCRPHGRWSCSDCREAGESA